VDLLLYCSLLALIGGFSLSGDLLLYYDLPGTLGGFSVGLLLSYALPGTLGRFVFILGSDLNELLLSRGALLLSFAPLGTSLGRAFLCGFSKSFGLVFGMNLGIFDDLFDHDLGFPGSNFLFQCLLDESGSELDSSSSSLGSLVSGDRSTLVGTEIFFSDLHSDLASDGSQLAEGLMFGVLGLLNDLVDCDN